MNLFVLNVMPVVIIGRLQRLVKIRINELTKYIPTKVAGFLALRRK